MRVRFFVWLLLILSCVGVLTFAFLLERNVPALMQASLDQPSPKAQRDVALLLHLTDPEGAPIDSASVLSHTNMITMNMGENKQQLQSVGQGNYLTHLQFSMVGSWFVTVSVHANGIVPAQQKLFVNVTS